MSFSQHNTNANSLMGFSVHQPSVGASLQFFPPMGSQQLDEMIDAYVPGSASILDKRAAVTCEFFHYSNATGELFKFFMVYPSHASESFESPVSLNDSGYGSHSTSPIMSENQWASTSTSKIQAASSSKKPGVSDFSHLPGMKIMTKDGLDVTNSASRGCKTKEQRDHAHLMRIIKACDSCRRKKVRCDPSHKKRSSHPQSPEPRTSKKVKKSSIASQTTKVHTSHEETLFSLALSADVQPASEVNDSFDWSMSSLEAIPADEVDIFAETESWDQFINYGDESAATAHDVYDFTTYQTSPTTTSPTNTTSRSQPFTPSGQGLGSDVYDIFSTEDATHRRDQGGTFTNDEHGPVLPYLHNPGGVEGGTNYVDFNLYSPASSYEDDIGFSNEIAAASPDQQGFDRIDRDRIDDPSSNWNEHRHKADPNDQVGAGQSGLSVRVSRTPEAGIHARAIGDSPTAMTSPVYSESGSSSRATADDALRDIGRVGIPEQQVPLMSQTRATISPRGPPPRTRPHGTSEGDDRESPDVHRNAEADLRRTARASSIWTIHTVGLEAQAVLGSSSPNTCGSKHPRSGRPHDSTTSCAACQSHTVEAQHTRSHVTITSPLGGDERSSRSRSDRASAALELTSYTERGAIASALPAIREKTIECPDTTTETSRYRRSSSIFEPRSAVDLALGMSTSIPSQQRMNAPATVGAPEKLPDTVNRPTSDASAKRANKTPATLATAASYLAPLSGTLSQRRRASSRGQETSSVVSPHNACFTESMRNTLPITWCHPQTLAVYCGLATFAISTLVRAAADMQAPNDIGIAISTIFTIMTMATLAVLCRYVSCCADTKLDHSSAQPLSPSQSLAKMPTRILTPLALSTAMASIDNVLRNMKSRVQQCVSRRNSSTGPNSSTILSPQRQDRWALGRITGSAAYHGYLYGMC